MARILIIDDDPAVGTTIASMLELDGHDPVRPPTGREAVPAIEAGDYDLVITDMLMPELDGIEVLRLVRRTRPGCPILVISGGSRTLGSGTLLHMAEGLGATATLDKPFLRADLQAALGRLLAPA